MSAEGLGRSRAEHHEAAEQAGFFNVGAMSDDQIVTLYRGIGQARLYGSEELYEVGISDVDGVADSLFDALAYDMRDHAAEDPERVKAFVERCLATDQEIDAEFAASVVPGLVDYDYAFTRDILVGLECERWEQRRSGRAYASLPDSVRQEIVSLMNDRLTPEQRDDFNTKITALGGVAIGA